MLEYFRMVGKGGKDKEEKNLEVETSNGGNKPIDTVSLIAALHPFGQGGVKLCSNLSPVVFFSHLCTVICPLHVAQLCEPIDPNLWVIIACGCNFYACSDLLIQLL